MRSNIWNSFSSRNCNSSKPSRSSRKPTGATDTDTISEEIVMNIKMPWKIILLERRKKVNLISLSVVGWAGTGRYWYPLTNRSKRTNGSGWDLEYIAVGTLGWLLRKTKFINNQLMSIADIVIVYFYFFGEHPDFFKLFLTYDLRYYWIIRQATSMNPGGKLMLT